MQIVLQTVKRCRSGNLQEQFDDLGLHLFSRPAILNEIRVHDGQGPVVQSIISQTTLLDVNLSSICRLNYQIHCYFLLEKCENLLQLRIFCTAKDSHIFPTKNNSVFVILMFLNFNETLANDVVNFEQQAPGD